MRSALRREQLLAPFVGSLPPLLCVVRYPSFGVTSGSAVVNASDGRVVGVHTQIMADIIGQFQTLAHKPVLRALRAANIVTGAQSSAMATPEVDGFLYE